FDVSALGVYSIQGVRGAEYLNWRYIQNPLAHYRVLVARQGSALLGYAVLEVGATSWVVTDLQGVDQESTVPALLTRIEELAREMNIERISAPMMTGSPLNRYLRSTGFQARDSAPVIVYANAKGGSAFLPDTKKLFLMNGDRES